MVRYVSLLRFTEKGSAGIKDSTQRAESFNLALAGTGVDIVGQYWTMGSYDGVLILDRMTEMDRLASRRALKDLESRFQPPTG